MLDERNAAQVARVQREVWCELFIGHAQKGLCYSYSSLDPDLTICIIIEDYISVIDSAGPQCKNRNKRSFDHGCCWRLAADESTVDLSLGRRQLRA